MEPELSVFESVFRVALWFLVPVLLHAIYMLFRSLQVQKQRPMASYPPEDLDFAFKFNPSRRAIYEARGTVSRYELSMEAACLPVALLDELAAEANSRRR